MIGELPEGIDVNDVVIRSYEEMDREELIACCHAHDDHHAEHHEWLEQIKAALYPDGIKHPQQGDIQGIVDSIKALTAP